MATATTKLLAEDSSLAAGGIQYTLYYRTGQNPHPLFLFFYFPSFDIRLVVERAKRHCDVMNYRFVSVRQSVVDLDKAENFLTNREG